MQADLHLSDEQMGHIFGAFALSYALFEIPTGWLGDLIGSRKVLIRIVLWSSAFTAADGHDVELHFAMGGPVSVGAGEAGGFPNLTKVFTTWLPQRERLRAQAIMWTAARWAGAFTPKLVFWVFLIMSWRGAFGYTEPSELSGPDFRCGPDDPTHPKVNAAEAAIIGDTGRNVAGTAMCPGQNCWPRAGMAVVAAVFSASFPLVFLHHLDAFLPENYWETAGRPEHHASHPALFLGGLGSMFCGWVAPAVL